MRFEGFDARWLPLNLLLVFYVNFADNPACKRHRAAVKHQSRQPGLLAQLFKASVNFILGGDDHPPAHRVRKRQVLSQDNYAAIKTHWFKLETAHSNEEGRLKGHGEAERRAC